MACTTVLPQISFDDACPTIKRGQVYKIYTTRATTVDELADVTDLGEWTDRLDQSAAVAAADDPCAIREWTGIGSWGEGEVSDLEIPLDGIYSLPGNKVLSFKVYDLTTLNSTAFVALRDARTVKQKVWTCQDDTIWGGNEGIDGYLRADLVVPEGRADLQYGQITFTTKASINAVDTTPFTIL
jgi:hypothetical protein